MPKRMKQLNKTEDPGHAQETTRPTRMENVAHQIAILVVRQHRRLWAKDGKKNGGNALY